MVEQFFLMVKKIKRYNTQSKKVYLIGAGPGKADLITVRGLRILKEADVVIYDYLVDTSLLENVTSDVKLFCCDKLAARERYAGGSHLQQRKINTLLIKKARAGKRVVRLKNGDPSIFGRCTEELIALRRANIQFEVVPGVTAASAASCASGIPLTDRWLSSSCVFVTGHERSDKNKSFHDWAGLSKINTVVLHMAVGNLGAIVRELLKAGKGKKTPVAIIENATLRTQKIVKGSLDDIVVKARKNNVTPPAIVIIGDVVKREQEFNWIRTSRRILYTGLSAERYFQKALYFHLPLIKIIPLDNYRAFDNHLRAIEYFDWIVFTSRYGVKYFFERLKAIKRDARKLADTKIAAIGESTKRRLLEYGMCADVVPKNESSLGLLDEFKRIHIKGKKVFLPRSDIADKGLGKALTSLGAQTTSCFAYRNVMPHNLPNIDFSLFDEILFTSPSTVRNFLQRYKAVPRDVIIRCIGEVTLKEARKYGLQATTDQRISTQRGRWQY